ncbi:MAG: hypothetical protein HY908_36470, partial [Myxococcales bacterium]|nr:hypothetical protein [Myxococcales bacterium]
MPRGPRRGPVAGRAEQERAEPEGGRGLEGILAQAGAVRGACLVVAPRRAEGVGGSELGARVGSGRSGGAGLGEALERGRGERGRLALLLDDRLEDGAGARRVAELPRDEALVVVPR